MATESINNTEKLDASLTAIMLGKMATYYALESVVLKKSIKQKDLNELLVGKTEEKVLLDTDISLQVSEHDALNKTIAEQKQKKETLELEINDINIERDNLLSYVEDKAQEQKTFELSIHEKTQEYDSLTESIAKKNTELVQLETLIAENKKQIDILETENGITVKKENVDSLNEVVQQNKTQIDELQKINSQNTNEINSITEAVENNSSQHEVLLKGLSEKQTQYDNLKANLIESTNKFDHIVNELEQKNSSSEKLTLSVSEQSVLRDTLANEIVQLKDETERFHESILEKSDKLDSLLVMISEKSTEIAVLEKEISDQTTLSDELTPLISKQKNDVDKLALALVNCNEQIAELTQNISDKTIEYDVLASSITDQKATLDQLIEQISELTIQQEKFDDLTPVSERKEAGLKLAKVMSERYALELTILETMEPYNQLEADIETQKSKLETLKQDANNTSQEHNSLLDNLLSNTAKNDELQIFALITKRDDLIKSLAEGEEDKIPLEIELSNDRKLYDELKLSLSSKNADYDALVNTLTLEHEELESLVSVVDTDNKKRDDLNSTLVGVESDLKALENTIDLDKKTVEKIHSEITSQTEAIHSLNIAISTASSEIERLKSQIELDADELEGLGVMILDIGLRIEPIEDSVQQETKKQDELVKVIDLEVAKQSELEQSIADDVAAQKSLEQAIEAENINIESLNVVSSSETPDSLQVMIQQIIEKRADQESEITKKNAVRDNLVELIEAKTKEYDQLSTEISQKSKQSKEIKEEIIGTTSRLDGKSLFDNEFENKSKFSSQTNVSRPESDSINPVDGHSKTDHGDLIFNHSKQRYDIVSSSKLDASKLLAEVGNLRDNILAAEKGKFPRTIMITSSVEGEGKTTTAIAMARALASDSSEKVLVISANAGKHALDDWYELDNEQLGFLDLLSGSASIPDTVIHKTDLEQLDILSCGNPNDMSIKNFDTHQLENLLDKLKSYYEYIIVDAPPILTSSSISLPMAQSFDGLIVVVHCNKTKKQQIQKTVKTVEVLGANIIGVILNNKSNYIPRWLYSWI